MISELVLSVILGVPSSCSAKSVHHGVEPDVSGNGMG